MKRKKPNQEPEPEDDDEDLLTAKPQKVGCQIGVGEVTVVANSLKKCEQTTLRLIKNKYIKSYLDVYKKKKLIVPSSIG